MPLMQEGTRGACPWIKSAPPARGLARHNKRFTTEEIIKIVATRCQILRLKCTKPFVRWGSAPLPAGGAYSAPAETRFVVYIERQATLYGVLCAWTLPSNYNKKLIRRWDSARELTLRWDRTRRPTTKYNRLVHTFRHRSTQLCVGCLVKTATNQSEIMQYNGHYAVQGHSKSPILVPIESSYTTSY